MSRALLSEDLSEARFRGQSLHHQAAISGDAGLEEAVSQVVRLLGPPGGLPGLGCGAAILAVSTPPRLTSQDRPVARLAAARVNLFHPKSRLRSPIEAVGATEALIPCGRQQSRLRANCR